MSSDAEILTFLRRHDHKSRWANMVLFLIAGLCCLVVVVAAATFSENQNKDHETLMMLKRHAVVQDIAQVSLLRFVASDHPDKDSVKLLEKIADDLESFIKENADADANLHDTPSNPGR